MKDSWEKRISGFDDFVKEKMAYWRVPGLAMVIVNDDQVILSQGFGIRNINEKLPVTPDTIFAIGSSTKPFTAMAVGMLVDEGLLEWDAPVRKYLPWFKMYDQVSTERVTVRDMLCHRTGLPRHDLMWYNSNFSRRDIVKRVQYLQPSKDFRSAWQYQNHMFVTLGYLIEEITGRTWEEFVQEKIFTPIDMNVSNFSINISQKSTDYSRPHSNKSENVMEIPFVNIDAIGPAGSINSNIKDMTKWLMLQLNKGKCNGRQIISEASIAQMHSPQIPCKLVPWDFKEVQHSSYGLAWFIDAYRGYKLIHHGGNIDGFSALTSFMPNENIGVAILTNMDSTSLPSALTYEIIDRLLGYEGCDWSKILKEEDTKRQQSSDQLEESIKLACKQGTRPSHSLEDYTGKFENPGYGIVTISLDERHLNINYNSLNMRLDHYHYDIYSFDLDYLFLASFHTDRNGNIDSVAINLETEPAIEEIVFTRIQDEI